MVRTASRKGTVQPEYSARVSGQELEFAILSGEILDHSDVPEWTGDPFRHYHRSNFAINVGINRVGAR